MTGHPRWRSRRGPGRPEIAGRGPPAVAVVIPVRNRRSVVRRAIESVLRQDFADFELVVVDDGSSDGTAEIVAAIDDPRIRLVEQKAKRGANAARNRGVQETTAPIISFLDSDDEFRPFKLTAVVDEFARQPDLGTLIDSYSIVNPGRYGGQPEDLINPPIATSDAFLAALFDSNVKSRRLRKSTSGMSIRRDIALSAGLFDEHIERRQDMEFLARLAKAGRCATTDKRLWIKHELPDSITFAGGGFVEASLVMVGLHPEYGASRSRFPADLVIYLWETSRRGGYRRAIDDLRTLCRSLGAAATVRLIGQGVRARLIDSRRGD